MRVKSLLTSPKAKWGYWSSWPACSGTKPGEGDRGPSKRVNPPHTSPPPTDMNSFFDPFVPVNFLVYHFASTPIYPVSFFQAVLCYGKLLVSRFLQHLFQFLKLLKCTDYFLSDCTNLSLPTIMDLLRMCLEVTHFIHEHNCQNEGAATGFPLSPIIANIFMEHTKEIAFRSASQKPSL